MERSRLLLALHLGDWKPTNEANKDYSSNTPQHLPATHTNTPVPACQCKGLQGLEARSLKSKLSWPPRKRQPTSTANTRPPPRSPPHRLPQPARDTTPSGSHDAKTPPKGLHAHLHNHRSSRQHRRRKRPRVSPTWAMSLPLKRNRLALGA